MLTVLENGISNQLSISNLKELERAEREGSCTPKFITTKDGEHVHWLLVND